jgi:hypothetical protein
MILLLGFLLGWWWSRDTGIRGAGMILKNSNEELLLLQDVNTSLWSFPKGLYKSGDLAYFYTALREMTHDTTFQIDKDYVTIHGACRFGETMYFYGTLIEDRIRIPQINQGDSIEYKGMGWFSRAELPIAKDKDIEDWVSAGMPRMCWVHDEF